MKILEHWHPALRSCELKKKPVEIELAGKKIVLFRNYGNSISAISSKCPHRGMNLSFGKVKDNRLTCPYHGWNYDGEGNGKSPCNPNMKIKTESYEAREKHGFIWLTQKGSDAKFPEFEISGYSIAGVNFRTAEAPLEPVIDNFHEFEHFPGTHPSIGYGFRQIEESSISFRFSPDKINIDFYPAENLFWLVRKIFNLPDGYKYFMNIEVNSSPIFSTYHQGWRNPETGEKSSVLINVVFFVPVNNHKTNIVMFLLTKKQNFAFFKNFFIKKMSAGIIDEDMKILNNLADKYMDVKEMRLGHHDKAIIEIRKRINAIYFEAPEKNSLKQYNSRENYNGQ